MAQTAQCPLQTVLSRLSASTGSMILQQRNCILQPIRCLFFRLCYLKVSCSPYFLSCKQDHGCSDDFDHKDKTHLLEAIEWQCVRNSSATWPNLPTCHEPFMCEHLSTPSTFNCCFLKSFLLE